MSEEFDKETTTRKVTSNSNTPVNGYNVTEEHTTRASDENTSNAVILGVLLFLAVGAGAVIFFLNSRPAPSPVLVPSPVDTVRERVIERNNTTIRETSPASPQATPRVEINVPSATVTAQPAPAPTVTVTAQPAPAPTATVTAQPVPITTPAPTPGSAN